MLKRGCASVGVLEHALMSLAPGGKSTIGNGKLRAPKEADKKSALRNSGGADVEQSTYEIGVWGLRPQRVQRRALAFLALLQPLHCHSSSLPTSNTQRCDPTLHVAGL
jgi:hypothetical protein